MQADRVDVESDARFADDPYGSVMTVVLSGSGYEGYVVIDSIVENTSAGGVRITADLPLDEVRELAREMTLKFALFHLPRGGAKAGLRMSPDLAGPARLRALSEFGSKLAPLIINGIYSPGMDMNCGPEELRAIYRGAGIELGGITDTSWFTALSVFHCLRACASLLKVSGRPLTLAIDGFGSVARHLADRLPPDQFQIAAVSTIEGAVKADHPYDPADLARRKDASGDRFVRELAGETIERGAVLATDVDIVLPSARTRVITPELAQAMKARAVVPIANAPYGNGTVGILAAKGLICLPGYLSNAGGVLASSLYDQGIPRDEVEALFSAEYRPVVDGILHVASRHGLPAVEVAASLARMHMTARGPRPTRPVARRIHNRFVRPRLPRWWRARSARHTFVANSRAVREEIARWERTG